MSFFVQKEKRWNPSAARCGIFRRPLPGAGGGRGKMRKTKKKSLFPWKRPQSRCHYVPCYSSVRAGLRNRQQTLLMRWTVQIPPSPVKTSTKVDVFFCFKTKKDGTRAPHWRCERQKKTSLFLRKRPQSRCHCVPCYRSVRAGLRNRQQALLMR